jgi:hypothetical protein
MPNLFALVPVVIFAWVCASTSGLTRIAIEALTPSLPATWLILASSGSLSTWNEKMPASSASLISASVLATPAKTLCLTLAPAAITRRISPALAKSKAEPRFAKCLSTARLPLALTA